MEKGIDYDRLISQCKKLIEQGAKSEDIDQYLKSEGLDIYQQANIVAAIQEYQLQNTENYILRDALTPGRFFTLILFVLASLATAYEIGKGINVLLAIIRSILAYWFPFFFIYVIQKRIGASKIKRNRRFQR